MQKDFTDRLEPFTDRHERLDNLVLESKGIYKLEQSINHEKEHINTPVSLSPHSNQETKILMS